MENKIAMIGISSVVCMLLVVLLFKGSALQSRIDANEVKKTKTRKKKPQTRKGSDKESKAKSKKYAISEHFAVKEKKVNPIKEILKKPLKWIKSLGKK